jgi:hypothetical protein
MDASSGPVGAAVVSTAQPTSCRGLTGPLRLTDPRHVRLESQAGVFSRGHGGSVPGGWTMHGAYIYVHFGSKVFTNGLKSPPPPDPRPYECDEV